MGILAWVCVAVAACRGADSPAVEGRSAHVELLSAFDLPHDDTRIRELSGITWDASQGVLYAISDTVPSIVPLRPSDDFKVWRVGDPVVVNVPDAWDGEGIALTPNGFYVANERGPHIYEVDRAGTKVAEIRLPPHFTRCVVNKALESLSLTSDGRYLFTANESTMYEDGPPPSAENGATVRILRHDLATGEEKEFAYRTDAVFAQGAGGEMGVSDMLAVSATDVLVMERAYVPSVGNAIRIYRATLGGADVIAKTSLSLHTKVAKKELFVDFASLPGAEMVGRLGKHFPNYEGLALGPKLTDGRRILFVISDDNANPTLVARILVLTVTGSL